MQITYYLKNQLSTLCKTNNNIIPRSKLLIKYIKEPINYQLAYQLQEYCFKLRKESIKNSLEENYNFKENKEITIKDIPLKHDILLLLEHTPTVTEGRRTKIKNFELEKKLKELNVDYYLSNRGGLTTYHGYGQLVGYPILSLKEKKLTTKCYIRKIEYILIETLKQFQLNGEINDLTGVWIKNNKIGAIGALIRQYITSHGFSLNINNEVLNYFNLIVPCGINKNERFVTTLSKELNQQITIEDVIPKLLNSFENLLNYEVEDITLNNLKLDYQLNEFILKKK